MSELQKVDLVSLHFFSFSYFLFYFLLVLFLARRVGSSNIIGHVAERVLEE